MRKFLGPTLAAGILAVFTLFLPSISRANPQDIPTGGGWIPAPDETVTVSSNSLGYFTDTTGAGGGFTINLTTPPVNYQYCVTNVVVTAPIAGVFEMWWSTATLGPGTTDYVVSLSSGIPYDHTWAYKTPYCSPPNALLNFYSSVVNSTMTVEGYTFKGWSNP
jgi:hypothetical protein